MGNYSATMEKGDKLYNNGKIEEALKTYMKAEESR